MEDTYTPPIDSAAIAGDPASYFIAKNGQKTGPFALEQIQSMLQGGMLTKADEAWRAGMLSWTPLWQLLGKSPSIATQNVPPPYPCGETQHNVSPELSTHERSKQVGTYIGGAIGLIIAYTLMSDNPSRGEVRGAFFVCGGVCSLIGRFIGSLFG